eukprot:TRINITY_DN8216_c0_g1_i1.p1 TRINITY_DN8216_c0_g1~~TRINITY_DN8216_c0_g1_i1.p1  ORF type:complete len:571 (-),score=109.13 TRINITY_DN8216_c0_g1_i1:187-1899(-)
MSYLQLRNRGVLRTQPTRSTNNNTNLIDNNNPFPFVTTHHTENTDTAVKKPVAPLGGYNFRKTTLKQSSKPRWVPPIKKPRILRNGDSSKDHDGDPLQHCAPNALLACENLDGGTVSQTTVSSQPTLTVTLSQHSNEHIAFSNRRQLKSKEKQHLYLGTQPASSEDSEDVLSCKANAAICQLLKANLCKFLDIETVFALTLTSKAIFEQLVPFISKNNIFFYPDYRTPLRHYHPRTLQVKTLKQLFEVNASFLNNLREIKFHDSFNSSFVKLPDTVKQIVFGSRFNKKVDSTNLPRNLTHIHFDREFNQLVDDLPKSLTHICFQGGDFNRDISSLPPNIIELTIHGCFNQPLTKLPSSLIRIEFHGDFDQPLLHLPHSVLHLTLSEAFHQKLTDLPPHLISLYLKEYCLRIPSLPSTLQRLTFDNTLNKKPLPISKLPSNLLHLIIKGRFNDSLPDLPQTLERLTLSDHFDRPLNDLPPSLLRLELGSRFCQTFTRFPPNLVHLKVAGKFDFDRHINILPPSLKILHFGPKFYTYIQQLPPNIKQVYFNNLYNQSIDHLSKDVQFLTMGF